MNPKLILLLAVAAFLIAIKFYASFMEKILEVKKSNLTPAHRKYDGLDFVPAKYWLILFGHHFSSIAGAGPIVGPILAFIWWGPLPAIIWAVVGSIFIGGVHDFLSLIASVREEGVSVGTISEKFVSRRAAVIFLVFVWLALVLVVSVFALVCTKTFVEQPGIALPTLGIIPVAFLVGFLIYKANFGIVSSTLIGLGSLAVLLIFGRSIPITLSFKVWIAILMVYAYFASVIPVHLLLQPRDYLSSFLLFFGLITMSVGVFVSKAPEINYPLIKAFHSPQGGFLWPMMFITMACGAISGFHSLVASGTTSKQLSHETDAKKIGYIGMLVEGLLAVLVILCVIMGAQILGSEEKTIDTNMAIQLFSQGYGMITAGFLKGWGPFIAVIILNAFILTTLDTATRITRYVTQELFKIPNKFIATGIVVGASLLLIFSESWQKLWQVFGASNQLLASFTLLVVSMWLLSRKRPYLFSFIPGLLMLATSQTALLIKAVQFSKDKNFIMLIISGILMVLGIFMLTEVLKRRGEYAKT